MKEFLNSLPSSYISIGLGLLLGFLFFIFIFFNRQILRVIGNAWTSINNFVSSRFGGTFRNLNKRFRRTAFLNKESLGYRVYHFFDDIIINLNLQKNGVTVFGLILFMGLLSALLSVAVGFIFNFDLFLYLAMFGAAFVLVLVVFRFNSLNHKEQVENEIMDAVDLLVSDVRGGIYNAIVRYMDSFHPDIKPYFREFIDNVTTKGLSFKAAMLVLNERLGSTFSDFAHKAIMYEEKADADFDDIFSAILEVNRHKRILRAKNNLAFQQLMLTFVISFGAVVFFAFYITSTEDYVRSFLLNNVFGKFMLIGDVIIFVVVMGYLTSLKARSFE